MGLRRLGPAEQITEIRATIEQLEHKIAVQKAQLRNLNYVRDYWRTQLRELVAGGCAIGTPAEDAGSTQEAAAGP